MTDHTDDTQAAEEVQFQGFSPVKVVLIIDAVLFGFLPILGVLRMVLINLPISDNVWSIYYSWYAAAEPLLGYFAICSLPIWLASYVGVLMSVRWAYKGNQIAKNVLMVAVIWFNLMHIAGLIFRSQLQVAGGIPENPDTSTVPVRALLALFLIVMNAVILYGPIGRSYFGTDVANDRNHANAS